MSKLVIFITLIFFACNRDNAEERINGVIKKIYIKNYSSLGHGCLRPEIHFVVDIFNNTMEKEKVNFEHVFRDPCEIFLDESRVVIKYDSTSSNKSVVENFFYDDIENLLPINFPYDTILLPNDSLRIDFIVMSYLHGINLKRIWENYSDFFNSSFYIESINTFSNHPKVKFEKSKNIEIVLVLDNLIVDEKDSVGLNKYDTVVYPNL
ncbi:MAG: hypothetical protein AB8B74_06825 [Crocinitomicaceae bacterium]